MNPARLFVLESNGYQCNRFLFLSVIEVRTDVLNVSIAPSNTDVACILGHDMV